MRREWDPEDLIACRLRSPSPAPGTSSNEVGQSGDGECEQQSSQRHGQPAPPKAGWMDLLGWLKVDWQTAGFQGFEAELHERSQLAPAASVGDSDCFRLRFDGAQGHRLSN
jgi:hypothetical protein